MDLRRLTPLLVVLALLFISGALFFNSALYFQLTDPSPSNYERTTVTFRDANGTDLATVSARVADTEAKRYVGLSDTASLAPGDGMLFVQPRPTTWTFVMREMSFPLDIVFIAPNGTVTIIHHASVPPSDRSGDELREYRGYAKYVLEVPRGYTNATGLDAGDRVIIPASIRQSDLYWPTERLIQFAAS